MCLAIPSKVISIDKERNVALVDTMGARRESRLDLYDMSQGLEVGDFVLMHIGYIINKIDEKAAQESIALYEEIINTMNEEDN